MKKFNWEDFKDAKFAVSLDSQSEYDIFMEECYKRGIHWSYIKEPFNAFAYATGDTIRRVCVDVCGGRLRFNSGYVYAEVFGIPVFEYKDFTWNELVNGVDWGEFVEGKIVVLCDTQEKYDSFMQECENRGYRWLNGDKAIQANMFDLVGKYVGGGELFISYETRAGSSGLAWGTVTPDIRKQYRCREYVYPESRTKEPTHGLDWGKFFEGELAVRCDTEEKWNEFMNTLQKMGVKWECGYKAVGFPYDPNDKFYGIMYNKQNSSLYMMIKPLPAYVFAEVYDYELKRKANPQETKPETWKVIIEGTGDTTTAKYIVGKKVVNTAEVKRYYKDKHSPKNAAHILLEKLFQK